MQDYNIVYVTHKLPLGLVVSMSTADHDDLGSISGLGQCQWVYLSGKS